MEDIKMKGKTYIISTAILLLLLATIPPVWINRTAKASDGAVLTGNVHDFGSDTDGDGSYNYLIAELEVSVFNAGVYKVEAYALIGERPYEYLWFYIFNQTYLNTGLQKISLKFKGLVIYQAKINVTKLADVYLSDAYKQLSYFSEMNLSRTYVYTEFEYGARFTGEIYDAGVDTDGDGLFNYLNITIGVDVSEDNLYEVSISNLANASYSYYVYSSVRAFLTSGTRYMTISIHGARIYATEATNIIKINWVYLYWYDEQNPRLYILDWAYEFLLNNAYNYTDFDRPAILTGRITDYGVDPDNDGLINYLNISVEIDVADNGLYEVSIERLANASNSYIYVYSNARLFLTTGTCYINLLVPAPKIFNSNVTNITLINSIKLFWIDELTYEVYQIDYIEVAPLSRSYNYNNFEYFARLTGKISDEGVDTDGNGLFNYLKVGVEIEVSEPGVYMLYAWLSENGGPYDIYQEFEGYFDEGKHTVYLEYYGPMLAYNRFSPASLIEIYLYDESTWTLLDYAPSFNLSRKYDYTLFDAPSEDMQVNFMVYPNGTTVLSGLFNYTHMYPQNNGPLVNASVSLSTVGSMTTGSLSGVLILPTDGMFQWPFNSTTALLKSKIQNGLSNTTLALAMLMPPAASKTYPFNSSDFELSGRYGNGMLNFNLFGKTKLPTSLKSMFPFNATDITVKADFENGEFVGNITFHLIPFIPGFFDIIVDFNGNRTELRLTDQLNITYGDYPPPIGKINSTILEGLLMHLNSTIPGPNGLIANMTDGLIVCTQLNTTKTEWPDGKGAEIRYNATLNGNFTMLFAKLLNQMMFRGSPQTEQFAYAILDSVFSSIEKASLTLDYYHTLGQATADITVSCNVARLWENALEKIPPTVPPDYTAQITAYLKILNATAYAIKDFRLDTTYSSDTQELTVNALMLTNSTQLEGDIIPLLPETAPTEQLRQIFEKYLSIRYCNLTQYTATINYANGRADFTATWTLEGNFKAELNRIKSFYIEYWNATYPWYMPWQLRILNETVIDASNFSAEIKLGKDWMLLSFNGIVLQPPMDVIDNVRFKLYRFFNMTSYDPYEPPREFQKLKITITGAFNGTRTILLYAPGAVPQPDFTSTDFKTMVWENVSISSLKDLEFRIAYQQVVNYIGTHNVIIFTNSTMSNFNFNPGLLSISFNVTGTTGTGFCQVAIPRSLLYASPTDWTVKIDGQTLSQAQYTVTENSDYVFITLNYTHSSHRIEIVGTWVVSEVNPNILPIILTIIGIIAAILTFQQRKNLGKIKMKCQNITRIFKQKSP
jgi:hypothetical protein